MPSLRDVTEAQLREWAENDRRRKELEREARALKSANDLIEDLVEAALKGDGKERARRFEFQLDLVDGTSVTVKWKEEFIRRNGADEATRLQAAAAAAPREQKLRITPPPAATSAA